MPDQVILTESKSPTHGRFVIGPFEKGVGTAMGNSLRRVLLSSPEGTAVATLKIDGILHEFSTLPNIYEDVTEIVLNVKKLRVKLFTDEPVVLVVEKEEPGPVTGGDVRPTTLAEIVNPDHLLCTISDKGGFRMEMMVRKGRGFITAEENVDEDQEIGVIPVDSDFEPVRRVCFHTVPLDADAYYPREELHLEIWTDGTLEPAMALVEAAKILRKHLNPVLHYHDMSALEDREIVGETREEISPADSELEELLERPVMELDLSVRASNCMTAENLTVLRDLVRHSEADLLKIRNFGKTTLVEVKKKLTEWGLTLNMDV
jgi:DNA-directed RNA polymerase subunit alpha